MESNGMQMQSNWEIQTGKRQNGKSKNGKTLFRFAV
jgi:hypothetical protein